MGFTRAQVKPFWLRLAIDGPAGSGKTWTALEVGTFFAQQYGQAPAYIDTERGSASKYAARFAFDVVEMKPPYHPDRFVKGIAMAVEAGYKVLIVDSLSHAWNGPGGLLEIVDTIAQRMHGNSYAAWKDATPIQTRLIDTLTGADLHIIACLRAKMDYSQEKDERGKTQIVKIGLAPVQREGMEYEFDVVGDMNVLHNLNVSKTRCEELTDQMFVKPGKDFAQVLWRWTQSGVTREQLAARIEAEKQAAATPVATPPNGAHGTNGTGAVENDRPFDDGAAANPAAAVPAVSPLAGLVVPAAEPAPAPELKDGPSPDGAGFTAQAAAPSPAPAMIKTADGTTKVIIDSREQFEDHIAGVLTHQDLAAEAEPLAQAPDPQPAKGKTAAASMAADAVTVFPAMCAKLVVDVPYYRNAQGGADMFRILRAAKAEGFDVVSVQNVTDVIARIAQRGIKHEQDAATKAARVEA